MEKVSKTKAAHQTIYEIFRACRLCGAGGGYKMPIIQNVVDVDTSETELRQKIKECVKIEVNQDDKMPPLICEMCVEKINDFYEFLNMCQETNQQTRQRLGLPAQIVSQGMLEGGDFILGVTEPVYVNQDLNEPLSKSTRSKKALITMKISNESKQKSENKEKNMAPATEVIRETRQRIMMESMKNRLRPELTKKTDAASAHRPVRRVVTNISNNMKEETLVSLRTRSFDKVRKSSSDSAYGSNKGVEQPRKISSNDTLASLKKKEEKKKKPAMESASVRSPSSNSQMAAKLSLIKELRNLGVKSKLVMSLSNKRPAGKPSVPAVPAKKIRLKLEPQKVAQRESVKMTKKSIPQRDASSIQTRGINKPPPPTSVPTSHVSIPSKPSPKSTPKTDERPTRRVRVSSTAPESLPASPKSTPRSQRTVSPPPPASSSPICVVCQITFKTNSAMLSHQRALHLACYINTNLACNACNEWFTSTEESKQHHNEEHVGEDGGDTREYRCRRCAGEYKAYHTFLEHLENGQCITWDVVPDLQCWDCWNYFPTNNLRSQHDCPGEDGRPGGSCSRCERQYDPLKNLREHEETCTLVRKDGVLVEAGVLPKLTPALVKVTRCDSLLVPERRLEAAGERYNVSFVSEASLDGIETSTNKFQGMVNISDDLPDFESEDSFVDSEESTDTQPSSLSEGKNVVKLSTLSLKKVLSQQYTERVPKKRRKIIKEIEDEFGVLINSKSFDKSSVESVLNKVLINDEQLSNQNSAVTTETISVMLDEHKPSHLANQNKKISQQDENETTKQSDEISIAIATKENDVKITDCMQYSNCIDLPSDNVNGEIEKNTDSNKLLHADEDLTEKINGKENEKDNIDEYVSSKTKDLNFENGVSECESHLQQFSGSELSNQKIVDNLDIQIGKNDDNNSEVNIEKVDSVSTDAKSTIMGRLSEEELN